MNAFLPLSIAALLATAGAAAAENTFTLDRANTGASRLALSTVAADQAGTVEVWAVEDGRATQFLGSSRIVAGTTAGVDVALGAVPEGDIEIHLTNDNRTVSKLVVDDLLTN